MGAELYYTLRTQTVMKFLQPYHHHHCLYVAYPVPINEALETESWRYKIRCKVNATTN